MPEQKTPKRQIILISASLVLLILAAFEPIRHNDFVSYDDDKYITENPHIQSGITRESVAWAFTTGHEANWHPLTWLSHMLDIELFGLNPLGHHLHNLALHIAATVLLFIVLQSMTGAVWRSAFVAMAFGIHPLRVESVAWVAERKDVLCVLFWMLTMAAYLYYVKRGGLFRYLLVVLCFGLGLMAKSMIITLPIVLLILDFWPLLRLRSGQVGRTQKSADKKQLYGHHPASVWGLAAEKIPLFILTFASCIVTYLVQQKGGALNKLDEFPFIPRIANALVSYTDYLYKTALPKDLAVLYPNPFLGWPLWKPVVSFLLLASVSGIVIYNIKKRPYLFAGWLWYMVTLIPVIGLVQVGAQAMADRYSYLPSIGILIMLSWTAAQLSAKWRYQRILMGILSGLAAIAMVVGTRTQLAYWKNSAALYEHTLAVTENNYLIHNNLGVILLKQNRIDEAADHFKKALQIWPGFPAANNNLGEILWKQKRFDEAADHFKKALQTWPGFPEANNSLGEILWKQKRLDEAATHFKKALQVQPDFPEANINLAAILISRKQFDEAMAHLQTALKVKPDDTAAHFNMGLIFEARGKFDEAMHAYEQVIQFDQNYFQAFNNLGVLKIQHGLLDEAIRCFRQSIQINPKYVQAYCNLGSALQSQDRTEEAIPYYRTALQIEPNNCMTQCDLGISLQISGKLDEAVGCYRQALQLKPDFIMALNNLAWILSTSLDSKIQNPAEAVQLARKACQQTSFEDPNMLDTLAAAYAAAGQFKEAIETAQKAIDAANAAGQTGLASKIENRLQLYQAGKPYQSQ